MRSSNIKNTNEFINLRRMRWHDLINSFILPRHPDLDIDKFLNKYENLPDFVRDRSIANKKKFTELSSDQRLFRVIAEELTLAPLFKRKPLRNRVDLEKYCIAHMGMLPYEQLRVLYLDAQRNLMADEIHNNGSTVNCGINVKEIIFRCAELSSFGVVMVHNHPSGDLTPSSQDITETKRIQSALELCEVKLLDHLIVGGGHTISFHQFRLLKKIKK